MGRSEMVLQNRVPSFYELEQKFQDIDELGVYLHIPFCEQICPYCPYNKEIYSVHAAEFYTKSVKREIDYYSQIIGTRPITTFYIGGGTPTTMLHTGIGDIINHLYAQFNMCCDIHMESHPKHLNQENLDAIRSMGVTNLSVGVESLQDRHLRTLNRPYSAKEVRAAIHRVVERNFSCVNVDIMFALPDQTYDEVEEAGKILVDMGISQIAAYPIFRFPYTKMGGHGVESIFNWTIVLKRRRMLAILERLFYDAGFERSSVWAFTKQGVPKYCSVTVPLYIGLGASGGTYLKDIFYLNTFNADEYIKAFENGGLAIALSLDLSDQMQMAGWLYWRIYETKFKKMDFRHRFGRDIDCIYGNYLKLLARAGFLTDDGAQVILTDKGAYWLHAFEDIFSIDYIGTLWGTSKQEPWPEKVVL